MVESTFNSYTKDPNDDIEYDYHVWQIQLCTNRSRGSSLNSQRSNEQKEESKLSNRSENNNDSINEQQIIQNECNEQQASNSDESSNENFYQGSIDEVLNPYPHERIKQCQINLATDDQVSVNFKLQNRPQESQSSSCKLLKLKNSLNGKNEQNGIANFRKNYRKANNQNNDQLDTLLCHSSPAQFQSYIDKYGLNQEMSLFQKISIANLCEASQDSKGLIKNCLLNSKGILATKFADNLAEIGQPLSQDKEIQLLSSQNQVSIVQNLSIYAASASNFQDEKMCTLISAKDERLLINNNCGGVWKSHFQKNDYYLRWLKCQISQPIIKLNKKWILDQNSLTAKQDKNSYQNAKQRKLKIKKANSVINRKSDQRENLKYQNFIPSFHKKEYKLSIQVSLIGQQLNIPMKVNTLEYDDLEQFDNFSSFSSLSKLKKPQRRISNQVESQLQEKIFLEQKQDQRPQRRMSQEFLQVESSSEDKQSLILSSNQSEESKKDDLSCDSRDVVMFSEDQKDEEEFKQIIKLPTENAQVSMVDVNLFNNSPEILVRRNSFQSSESNKKSAKQTRGYSFKQLHIKKGGTFQYKSKAGQFKNSKRIDLNKISEEKEDESPKWIQNNFSFGGYISNFISSAFNSILGNQETQNQPAQQPKIITKEAILQKNSSVFTCFDVYVDQKSQQVEELRQRYYKTSKKESTIIFEPLGVFFQFLDPNKDSFSISSRLVRQFIVQGKFPLTQGEEIEGIPFQFLMTLQYNAIALQKQLVKLSDIYELIIYTSLPKNAINEFLDKTQPDLRPYFSHVISHDDFNVIDAGYLIKDCSILLGGRSVQEILVVACDKSAVDKQSLSSMILQPYEGTESYENLIEFNQTLANLANLSENEDSEY